MKLISNMATVQLFVLPRPRGGILNPGAQILKAEGIIFTTRPGA